MVYIIAEPPKKSNMKENGSLLFKNQIFINTRIDDNLVDNVIKNLDTLTKVYKEIFVFLNSSGGDVPSAQRLYEKVTTTKNSKLIGIAGENISSAAAMIFQGFKLRLILPETKMLLHNIDYTVSINFIPHITNRKKTFKAIEAEIKKAYSMQDYINRILIKSSGMKENEIMLMLVKKTTLNAGQILQYGLADAMYNPALLL